jgi:DNA-binding NarL/FixJ family response regulator
MKVFFVDDSVIVVERLKNLLTEIEGIEAVGHAVNEKDAVDLILKTKPDLVILDIRLRSGNGIEVLARIKKEHPPPVVIMLTNYPYPQYRKRCMELGADYFFDKVTEIEKVIEVVKRLVKNKTAKRHIPD